MDSKCPNKTRQTYKFSTDLTETKQQIPIDCKIEAFIDLSADFLPETAPPEHCFLRYIIGPLHDLIIVRKQHPTSDLLIHFVDYDAMTVYHIYISVLCKEVGN